MYINFNQLTPFLKKPIIKFSRLLFIVYFSSIGLSACGGSDSTATTTANIDSSNATKIVKVAAPLAMGFDESIELTESIVPRKAESATPLVIATEAALSRLGGTTLRSISLADTGQCAYSGSMNISAKVSDPDTLTKGDIIKLTFNACAISYDETINGQLTMTINNFSGNIDSPAILLDVKTQFSDLTVSSSTYSSTMNGDISVALDRLTEKAKINISGNSFTTTSIGNTQSISNFANTYSKDSSQFPVLLSLAGKGIVGSSQFSGVVSYQTPVSFAAWGDNFPDTGELLITGANNATLHLTVLSDIDIQINADYNGDGVTDETFYMTWSELKK